MHGNKKNLKLKLSLPKIKKLKTLRRQPRATKLNIVDACVQRDTMARSMQITMERLYAMFLSGEIRLFDGQRPNERDEIDFGVILHDYLDPTRHVLPPVCVCCLDGVYNVWDGGHRFRAVIAFRQNRIPAIVHYDDRIENIWYSAIAPVATNVALELVEKPIEAIKEFFHQDNFCRECGEKGELTKESPPCLWQNEHLERFAICHPCWERHHREFEDERDGDVQYELRCHQHKVVHSILSPEDRQKYDKYTFPIHDFPSMTTFEHAMQAFNDQNLYSHPLSKGQRVRVDMMRSHRDIYERLEGGLFEEYVEIVVGRMTITESGSSEFVSSVNDKTSTDYISQVGLLFCILYCREASSLFRTGDPEMRKCHKSLSDANTIDTMALLEEHVCDNVSKLGRAQLLNNVFNQLGSLFGAIREAQQPEGASGKAKKSEWVWIANFVYFCAFGVREHKADHAVETMCEVRLIRRLLKVSMTVGSSTGGTVLSDKKRGIRMQLFDDARREHYTKAMVYPQLSLPSYT